MDSAHGHTLFDTAIGTCGMAWGPAGITAVQLPEPTPEGTRQRVEKWKNGFWHIARAARVPILPVYFDYPSRTIGLGPLFEPSSELDRDVAALRAFYAPFRGQHRGTA